MFIKIKRSIKNTFTFYLFVIAFLPLVLATIINIKMLSRDLINDIKDKNMMLAKSLSEEVERFLETVTVTLKQLADFENEKEKIGSNAINLHLQALLKHSRVFDVIYVLNNSGIVKQIAPFNNDYIGINLSGMKYFRIVKKTKKLYWSDTTVSSKTGLPVVILAIPYKNGVVAGYVDLEILNRITDTINSEEKGYAIITDKNGVIIAHPNRTTVYQRINIKNLKVIQEGLNGKEGTYKFRFNDLENIGSVTKIPSTGWVMVIVQPLKTAFLTVRTFTLRSFIYFTVIVIVTLIFTYLSLRKAIAPLGKLVLMAREIANGNYDIAPLEKTYTEIRELEKDFRLMIRAIRKREQKIRENQEKYRMLVEKMNEGFEIEDESEIITYVNEKFCEITGYKKEELIGDRIYKCLNEKSIKKLKGETAKRKNGELGSYEIEIIRKDGEKRFVIVSPQGIYDAEGIFKGSFSVITDITDKKKMEEERKKLDNEVQKILRMESIGTLAGGIAHDFNNLLMAISGNVALMLTDKDPQDPDIEYLKAIEQCVKDGSALTKQLLGFARGGKYEIKPTNLNDIVEKSSKIFGSTKKEITIHKDYTDKIWTTKVDRGQIEQVLMNMYINAWQAMPSGGHIYLRTENIILDDNFFADKPYKPKAGKYVRISITDTGIGMDKETQKRIFDPFFTTKERSRGTGLGLSSAYGIIKNHNGFIDVYSKKGKGTTFSIYLPAAEVKEGDTEHKYEKEKNLFFSSGNELILLIDDEEIIRKVGKSLLEKLNYKVLVASSGKEAIEIYKKHKNEISIVILDMIMPNMDGSKTYDKLKKLNPEIKVLLASGYSIDSDAKRILEQGVYGFIQKPFDLASLSKKIREILLYNS